MRSANIKIKLGLAIVIFTIMGCGVGTSSAPNQPNLETIVASTLEALTPSPEEAPPVAGMTISDSNISFIIPTGIGTGAQVEKIEAILPSEDYADWSVSPAHNEYIIQGYVLPDDRYFKPTIYVYPANEFAQLHEGAAANIAKLQNILSAQNQNLPEYLPLLPLFNAAQVFHSNEQVLNFQNGNGIRYITAYSQSPNPIVNRVIFYTYQGLTSDNKYYVSVIMPISHPLLAEFADKDTQPPAGGIPFDWGPNGYENIPAYIEAVVQLLNSSDANTFTPDLSSLDALIQSIQIESAP